MSNIMQDALKKASLKFNQSPEMPGIQQEKNSKQKAGSQTTNKKNKKIVQSGQMSSSYIGAPYNFVPFPEEIYDYKKQNRSHSRHNDVSKDLISGVLTYQIKACTPIMVGGIIDEDSNSVEFYKNAKGNFAIPGSTVRGLIRTNAQILGMSYVGDDISDYYLMYRDITQRNREYVDILGRNAKTVKAGYIKKQNGSYTIFDVTQNQQKKTAQDNKNYYMLSERYISEHSANFNYLYSNDFGHHLQYRNGCRFIKYLHIESNNNKRSKRYRCKTNIEIGKFLYKEVYFKADQEDILDICWNNNGGEYFKGKLIRVSYQPENSDDVDQEYIPFYARISYKLNKDGDVVSVNQFNPTNDTLNGYLVGTGFMNEKKALYIIPEIAKDKKVKILKENDSSIIAYNVDLNKKEKTIKKNAVDFYMLPEEGHEARPVFYTEHNNRFYFGYTPFLRLLYDYSIKHGLPQKKPGMDYGKALFGYTEPDQSYKSRLSFTDAEVNKTIHALEEKCYIMSSPKPTSYLDYLQQKDGEAAVTYNTEDFKLRGIKQYWNKKHIDKESLTENNQIWPRFCPLPDKTCFLGHIRFYNLTRDELGLLIWSTELDEGCYQNLGKGKAYGYGRVQINVTGLEIWNKEKAYNLKTFCIEPMESQTNKKEFYIKSYKDTINRWLGTCNDIYDLPNIQQFFRMKKTIMDNDSDPVFYMKIDDEKKGNEYQKRLNGLYRLNDINEICDKHDKKNKNKKG